jgi:hypothetical protein
MTCPVVCDAVGPFAELRREGAVAGATSITDHVIRPRLLIRPNRTPDSKASDFSSSRRCRTGAAGQTPSLSGGRGYLLVGLFAVGEDGVRKQCQSSAVHSQQTAIA